MNDCLFCKIAKGIVPAEKVFEDDSTVAFLDITPKAPGHTILIPKAHAENIFDLPDDAVGPFFTAVKKVAYMVKKTLKPDGFTLGMNHGKVAGQAIDHLHFHIIPRWRDDGGRSLHAVVDNPVKEKLEVVAEKIRSGA